MGKINRSDSNLYSFPRGAFIRNHRYVYINVSNRYVTADKRKDNGTRGYTGHESKCIGVLQDPENPDVKMFYANDFYLRKLSAEKDNKNELPDPPPFADSIEIGLHIWIKAAAESSGLLDDLRYAFGEEDAYQILDLAAYMISTKSAVMQLYPPWARDHGIFSGNIPSGEYLEGFPEKHLTISKINLFRNCWEKRNIGDGRLFLCNDSMDDNRQAEGVHISQESIAKENTAPELVNTDYVIRQTDGLPFSCPHSPGSLSGMAPVQEMSQFLRRVKDLTGSSAELCLLCDKGTVSIDKIKKLDEAAISYIFLLNINFAASDALAEAFTGETEDPWYELSTTDGDVRYEKTVPYVLYEGGPECCAQIIKSESVFCNKKGLVSDAIMIFLTREKLTAQECIDAYCMKDRMQETLMPLKNQHDTKQENGTAGMHGLDLIWFVASILHMLLFTKTAPLREKGRKSCTVPMMISALEAIKADRNPQTNKRERRYRLTEEQGKILALWDVGEKEIDHFISNLTM